MGIDPPEDDEASDPVYAAHRALLLRALPRKDQYAERMIPIVEEHKSFEVDEVVFYTINYCEYLKHCARSMEALLLMSELEQREVARSWTSADAQILQHVDESSLRTFADRRCI